MKSKSTFIITMLILCFGSPKIYATVVFEDGEPPYPSEEYEIILFADGKVHNVDWTIDATSVYVSESHDIPRPWNKTTLNLLPNSSITGNVLAFFGGIVNISGGTVRNLILLSEEECTISDGQIFDKVILYSGSLTISGGQIGGIIAVKIESELFPSISTITLIGSNFAVDGISVDYGVLPSTKLDYIITGMLANGDLLNNHFYRQDNSNIILVEAIPEPTTLLLLSLGSLVFIKTKRKKEQK